MYYQDENKNTPMRQLIAKFPELIPFVFNKCIVECPFHNDIHSIDYALSFNMDLVEDGFLDLRDHHGLFSACCVEDRDDHFPTYLQETEIKALNESPETSESEKEPYPLGWLDIKNDPVMMMVRLQRNDLFRHPLLVGLLRLRRFILFLLDVNKIAFALLYAITISIIMMTPSPDLSSCKGSNLCDFNSTCLLSKIDPNESLLMGTLFIQACIGLFLTLIHIILVGSQSLGIDLILSFTCCTLGILISLDLECCPDSPGFTIASHWQWSVGVDCLFLSWISFISKMTDIAYVGIFVRMMMRVLMTFINIFFVILPMIVVFSTVMYTMLQWSKDSPFGEGGEAILKTFIMTLGEFEYEDLKLAIQQSPLEEYEKPFIYIYFVFFLLIMPIIVMNLLLGLAVGDIETIRCIANVEDLKTKALRSLAFQYQLPSWLQSKVYGLFSGAKCGNIQRLEVGELRPYH